MATQRNIGSGWISECSERMQRQPERVYHAWRGIHEFFRCDRHGERGFGRASRQPQRDASSHGSIVRRNSRFSRVSKVNGRIFVPISWRSETRGCYPMKLTPFLFGSIDRKEESAALPSREGAAALLGGSG